MSLYRSRYHVQKRNLGKERLSQDGAAELIQLFLDDTLLQQEFYDSQVGETNRVAIPRTLADQLGDTPVADVLTFMYNRYQGELEPVEVEAEPDIPAVELIPTKNPDLQQYPKEYVEKMGWELGEHHYFMTGELGPDPVCPHCGQNRDMDIPNVVVGTNEKGKVLQCKRLYCPSGGRKTLILE